MMLKVLLLIALCVTFAVAQEVDKKLNSLPKSIKTCKRNSGDYSSCLRLAIQESWPAFMKGIPELKSLPPLDPFVTKGQVYNYDFGGVSRKYIISATSYGLRKTKFLSVRPTYDGSRFKVDIDIEIPKVFVEGQFDSDAASRSLDIIPARGLFNVSMEGISGTIQLDGDIIGDYWIIKTFNFMPEVDKMRIWTSDLFQGSEDLNKAALGFINEHWKIFYRTMLPAASKSWNIYLRDFINTHITSKLAFSKLFPE